MRRRSFFYYPLFLLLGFLVFLFLVSPVNAKSSLRVYIVKKGDWLSSVADRFKVPLSSLITRNRIANPDLIYIGQRLQIPETKTSALSLKTYTVRWGDTLFSIASRFKTSLAYLIKLNNILNPNLVYADQKLVISGRKNEQSEFISGKPKTITFSSTRGVWVEVDLSQQKLYLRKGEKIIFSTLVSTGTARYPTPTGRFRVWGKFRSDDMEGGSKSRGDYYFLPKVPYVIYYYKSYALHGTYWHRNFGQPMSHGCINLSIPDSKYLYQHLKIGSLVVVHR